MRTVFVHGSGRSGTDAWPGLAGDEYVFVTRPGFGPGEAAVATDLEAESQLVAEALGEGAHLVAASYGALAALGAASASPDRVRSLVLVELGADHVQLPGYGHTVQESPDFPATVADFWGRS